jgi:hypothetical protein
MKLLFMQSSSSSFLVTVCRYSIHGILIMVGTVHRNIQTRGRSCVSFLRLGHHHLASAYSDCCSDGMRQLVGQDISAVKPIQKVHHFDDRVLRLLYADVREPG